MSDEEALMHRVRDLALAGAETRPHAVATLLGAATDILLEDIGPAFAVIALDRLTAAAKLQLTGEADRPQTPGSETMQ